MLKIHYLNYHFPKLTDLADEKTQLVIRTPYLFSLVAFPFNLMEWICIPIHKI